MDEQDVREGTLTSGVAGTHCVESNGSVNLRLAVDFTVTTLLRIALQAAGEDNALPRPPASLPHARSSSCAL